MARRHGDFAIAGAAVGVEIADDRTVRRATIGLLGLGSTPERGASAEEAVIGVGVDDIEPDDIGRRAVTDLASVPGDAHGSPDYRRHVAAVLVARAWRRAVQEASDARD